MELTAKLTQLLPIQTGIGKTGEWKKREVIVRTFENEPNDICISVWGDMCESFFLVVGESVKICFYILSAKYNSKWYTQVVLTDISLLADKFEQYLSIELQVEQIIFNNKSTETTEFFKIMTRNYFQIIGRTTDKYRNLIHLNMKGSVDPSVLKKGMILKVPIEIASTFKYGWITKLYSQNFEVIQK